MKKQVVAFLLFTLSSAMALPGAGLPPGEAGGELKVGELFKAREAKLPIGAERALGLVPLEEAPAETAEPEVKKTESKSSGLPPILVTANVRTYQKVAIGHRRRSLSSRGAQAAPGKGDDEIVYKTVAKVEKKQIDITPLIEKYATKHNLDPWLIRAVIEVESNFRPTAVSPVGAGGLMQLMPGTASYLGCQDRFDPEQNIAAGSRYLRMMLDRFGDPKLMIAAYNAGPGNVERYGGVPPFAETRNYVVKVTKAWKDRKRQALGTAD